MRLRFLLAGLMAIFILPAAGQAEGRLSLEINTAVQTDQGNCRLVFVAFNDTGVALERTEYEVAIFDAEGTVSRLLVLKIGALVAGKTRVLQFELPATECSGISRIIVNDASACADARGASSDLCMSALAASSRIGIGFGI